MGELVQAIDALPPTDSDRPTVVICETIKGKGVDFMEHNLAWHAGSLGAADLERAMASLQASREKESV
jgi:transketolase